MELRNNKGQFIKGTKSQFSFQKGCPPSPHKKNCGCPRCSKNPIREKNGKMLACKKCEKEKYFNKSQIANGQGQYCSLNCYNFAKKGKKWTDKQRIAIIKALPRGANHPSWVGERIGYAGWHDWAEKVRGKADKCENTICVYPRKDKNGRILLKPKRFELSSKSGLYLRKKTDIQKLCASCHRQYDKKNIPGAMKKFKETEIAKNKPTRNKSVKANRK